MSPAKSPSTPTIIEGQDNVRKQSVLSYSPIAHLNTIPEQLKPYYIKALPNIERFLLYCECKGRAKNTLVAHQKNLLALAQRANLEDQQAVELAIARYMLKDRTTGETSNRPATNNYKSKLCDTFMAYCKFNKIYWEKPIYTPEEKAIQPPTTEKCKMLCSSAKGALSIKIQISAETAFRPIEIQGEKGLKVMDFHADTRTLTNRNTKGCNARPAIKISEELTARLQDYITRKGLKNNDLLFEGTAKSYGESYRRFRNRLAKKLNDPSIATIRLYDLRHAWITKTLLRISNVEIVKQLVGHRRLDTTQKYLHLIASDNQEFDVQGADTKEQAFKLLSAGYTYIQTLPEGTSVYRKPKI